MPDAGTPAPGRSARRSSSRAAGTRLIYQQRPRTLPQAHQAGRPAAAVSRCRPAGPRSAPHLRGHDAARLVRRRRRRRRAAAAAVHLARARRPVRHLLVSAGRPGAARPGRGAPRARSSASDRARPDPGGVLHRAADRPAARQPAHRRRLPRHLPAAARASPQHAHRQAAVAARPRRPRRRPDRRVPRPPRTRPRQQRREPATPGSPRSTRCSATRRCATPSTPRSSAACSQSPPNAPTARSSRTSPEEIDALLAAPDRATWTGRRDHALLAVAIQTGLRVSELTGLNCARRPLRRRPARQLPGKGRKQRVTPLTRTTVAVLREWLQERDDQPDQPLFPTSRGRRLSRDAVALLLAKHTTAAAPAAPP